MYSSSGSGVPMGGKGVCLDLNEEFRANRNKKAAVVDKDTTTNTTTTTTLSSSRPRYSNFISTTETPQSSTSLKHASEVDDSEYTPSRREMLEKWRSERDGKKSATKKKTPPPFISTVSSPRNPNHYCGTPAPPTTRSISKSRKPSPRTATPQPYFHHTRDTNNEREASPLFRQTYSIHQKYSTTSPKEQRTRCLICARRNASRSASSKNNDDENYDVCTHAANDKSYLSFYRQNKDIHMSPKLPQSFEFKHVKERNSANAKATSGRKSTKRTTPPIAKANGYENTNNLKHPLSNDKKEESEFDKPISAIPGPNTLMKEATYIFHTANTMANERRKGVPIDKTKATTEPMKLMNDDDGDNINLCQVINRKSPGGKAVTFSDTEPTELEGEITITRTTTLTKKKNDTNYNDNNHDPLETDELLKSPPRSTSQAIEQEFQNDAKVSSSSSPQKITITLQNDKNYGFVNERKSQIKEKTSAIAPTIESSEFNNSTHTHREFPATETSNEKNDIEILETRKFSHDASVSINSSSDRDSNLLALSFFSTLSKNNNNNMDNKANGRIDTEKVEQRIETLKELLSSTEKKKKEEKKREIVVEDVLSISSSANDDDGNGSDGVPEDVSKMNDTMMTDDDLLLDDSLLLSEFDEECESFLSQYQTAKTELKKAFSPDSSTILKSPALSDHAIINNSEKKKEKPLPQSIPFSPLMEEEPSTKSHHLNEIYINEELQQQQDGYNYPSTKWSNNDFQKVNYETENEDNFKSHNENNSIITPGFQRTLQKIISQNNNPNNYDGREESSGNNIISGETIHEFSQSIRRILVRLGNQLQTQEEEEQQQHTNEDNTNNRKRLSEIMNLLEGALSILDAKTQDLNELYKKSQERNRTLQEENFLLKKQLENYMRSSHNPTQQQHRHNDINSPATGINNNIVLNSPTRSEFSNIANRYENETRNNAAGVNTPASVGTKSSFKTAFMSPQTPYSYTTRNSGHHNNDYNNNHRNINSGNGEVPEQFHHDNDKASTSENNNNYSSNRKKNNKNNRVRVNFSSVDIVNDFENYPSIPQSLGTSFVVDFCRQINLDAGHHGSLADIMDRQWTKLPRDHHQQHPQQQYNDQD